MLPLPTRFLIYCSNSQNISIPTVTEAHQLSFYTMIFFWDLHLLSFTGVCFPQIITLAITTPPGESSQHEVGTLEEEHS